MTHHLSLKTIEKLDAGLVADSFENHLANAVKDCVMREDDPRPRKVLLEVTIKPEISKAGGPTGFVVMNAAVVGKLPAHESVPYQCVADKAGKLKFNAEEPGAVNQTTLPGTQRVADAVARQNAKGGKT